MLYRLQPVTARTVSLQPDLSASPHPEWVFNNEYRMLYRLQPAPVMARTVSFESTDAKSRPHPYGIAAW